MPDIKTDSVEKPITLDDVMAAVGGLTNSINAVGTRVDNLGARVDAFEKAEDKKDDADDKDDKKSDADDKDDEKKDDADDKDGEKKDDAEDDKDDKKSDAAEEVIADAMKKSDDACKRADSAIAENVGLKKRIDAIEKRVPAERSDDDHRTMTGYQAKADSVYELFGRQAPRFLPGEGGASYRRRLVEGFKEHSASWKPVELATLADEAFAVAETQIYADAVAAAKNAQGVEEGGLRMVTGKTASGHSKTEFFGRTGALLNRFSGVRRYATSIRPNTNKSEVA